MVALLPLQTEVKKSVMFINSITISFEKKLLRVKPQAMLVNSCITISSALATDIYHRNRDCSNNIKRFN